MKKSFSLELNLGPTFYNQLHSLLFHYHFHVHYCHMYMSCCSELKHAAHLCGHIVVPSIHLSLFYVLSQQIAAPLIDQLPQQSPFCPLTIYEGMYQSKREAGGSCHNDLITFARSFPERLSPFLRHSFEAASEHGASCWLPNLLIAEHGFGMPKGEFRDGL